MECSSIASMWLWENMLASTGCDYIYTNKPSWQLSYRSQYIDLFLFSYNQSVLLCHSLNTNVLSLKNTHKWIQLHSQITTRPDVNWETAEDGDISGAVTSPFGTLCKHLFWGLYAKIKLNRRVRPFEVSLSTSDRYWSLWAIWIMPVLSAWPFFFCSLRTFNFADPLPILINELSFERALTRQE